MKRHVYLPALLLTAALLVGCGHKAQPDADADPNAQAALPPEGITALVLSDDTQVRAGRLHGPAGSGRYAGAAGGCRCHDRLHAGADGGRPVGIRLG